MGLIISQFKANSIDFKRNIGFNIDYFKKNFNFKDLDSVKEKDVIISSDHSNSYLLLKKFKIDGLIVIDQHIDLYDLEGLNQVFLEDALKKIWLSLLFLLALETKRLKNLN